MKKLSIFETSVIGFFIGVIVAAYTTFKIGSDGFVGDILNWISLHPIFISFHLPDSQTLVGFFVFTVLVFTIYGAIIGLIIKKINKSKLVLVPLSLLLVGIILEQNSSKAHVALAPEIVYSQAAVIKAVPQTPKQYFGNEVAGDINGDSKSDIAFIIHRKDEDRGTLYYLTSALTTDVGKTGTNLLFLGDKVNPQSISITNGIIDVQYTSGNSTTTENFYAQIVNGNLEKITSTTTSSN